MGIGKDIKSVIKDIGVKTYIRKQSALLSGESPAIEHCIFDVKSSTNEFDSSFFSQAKLAYDTDAVPGDVIEPIISSQPHIIMSSSAKTFQNETVEFLATLYRANVSGELSRPTRIDDEAWHTELTYSTVKKVCYASMTTANAGNTFNTTDDPVNYLTQELLLYLPSAVNIQTDDRYEATSGEFYRVTTVKKRIFENIDVAGLTQDTR